MTIEELKQKKQEYGYTNEQLSQLSGVPLGTVQKVMAGVTKVPRYATLQALEKVFRDAESSHHFREMSAKAGAPEAAVMYSGDPAQGRAVMYSGDPAQDRAVMYSGDSAQGRIGMYSGSHAADHVSETAIAYTVEKKHTIEDYMALPDDQRVELIDGVFYDMAAPRSEHQFLIGEIHSEFLEYVKRKKGKCLPFVSPIDVQLDCDDYTMVQPDVIILCDRGKIQNGHVMGAPDLVVEVLSASTSRKDRFLKLNKYSNAGVREYWIIDRKHKSIIVYWLDEESKPDRPELTTYTFADKVPVGIWDDECVVDFAEIDAFYTDVYGTEDDLW